MKRGKALFIALAIIFGMLATPISTYAGPESAPISVQYLEEIILKNNDISQLPDELPVVLDDGGMGVAPVTWAGSLKEGLQYVAGTVEGRDGPITVSQPVILLGPTHRLIHYYDATDTQTPVDGVSGNTLTMGGTNPIADLVDGSITIRGVAADRYCLNDSLVRLNGAGKYEMRMYARTDITTYSNPNNGFVHFSLKTWRSQSDRNASQEIRTTSGNEPCTFNVSSFRPNNEITELSYTFDLNSTMSNYLNASGDTFAEFRLKMQVNRALTTDLHILGFSIIQLDAPEEIIIIDDDPRIKEYRITPSLSDGVSIPEASLEYLCLKGIISGSNFYVAEDKLIQFTANIEAGWTFNRTYSRFFAGDNANASITAAPDERTVAFRYQAVKGIALSLDDLELIRINCTPDKLPILRITVPLSGGQSVNGVINNKNDWIGSLVVGGQTQYVTMTLEPGTKQYASGNSYEGRVDIRRRGNFSFGQTKTPYSLRMPAATSLLGIPATRRYAIIAAYSDPTLNMRNYLTYKTGWKMDGITYNPRIEYIELYINGDYRGVYCLTERVGAIEENMEDIVPASAGNITGGFLFEKEVGDKLNSVSDQWVRAPYNWSTTASTGGGGNGGSGMGHGAGDFFVFSDPDPTPEMMIYLSDHLHYLHYALISGEEDYTKYIDQSTWIDYLITQEVSKNVDGNMKTSTNMKKLRDDDAIYMGAFWDFDLSYGNANWDSPQPQNTYGFLIMNDMSPWLNALMRKPMFADEVKARYTKYRNTIYKEMLDLAEETGAYISDAAARDFSKFGSRGQVQQANNLRSGINSFTNWLNARLQWLDTQWYLSDEPAKNPNAGDVIINQVYGRADAGPQAISHGFVELYNTTDQPISLDGFSLQYAAGKRANNTVNSDVSWKVLDLAGKTIGARSSFLIRSSAGDGTATHYTIANADMDWNQSFSNRALQVALVDGKDPLGSVVTYMELTNRVIDMVGAVNTPGTPRTPQSPRDPAGAGAAGGGVNGSTQANWGTWFPALPFPAGTPSSPNAFRNPARAAVTAPDLIDNFKGSQFEGISNQVAARRAEFGNTEHNRRDFVPVNYRTADIGLVYPHWSGDGEWDDSGITINIAAIQGVTPPVAGEKPVTVLTETDQYTGTVTWSPPVTETLPGDLLMSLTRTEATLAEDGNQFKADSGVFADVSSLTAWNNNQQIAVGGTGRTPIVINNAAVNNNPLGGNGFRSVSSMDIDVGITVNTATAFQIKFATTGYKNIKFSASQKSTASGPEFFALAYSVNGPTGPFIAIPGSKVDAPKEAATDAYSDLRPSYVWFGLPPELEDKNDVYLRVYLVDSTLGNRASGNTSINDILIVGDEIGGDGSSFEAGGTFAEDTVYTATITITPKEGYTLNGVPADFFTVAGASDVSNDANSGVVTAVFATARVIDIAAVLGVTPPEAGAFPVKTITETAQYTGTVTWSPTPPEVGPDILLMSLTRTAATVAEDGNQFKADSGVFADKSNLTAWNNNQQIEIGGTGRTPIVINNNAVNNNPTGGNGWRSVGPMAVDSGITADTATAFQIKFSTIGYENIRFSASQKSTGSGPESFSLAYSLSGPTGPFTVIPGSKIDAPKEAANNEYADLRPSYTEFVLPSGLADQNEVYLRVYMVDCAFENRANGNTSINDLVIIGDTIDNGNAAGRTFAYDTVYTATITITPKVGYTLAGVPTNFFTVAGAAPVSNAANSGVVTAVFPITGRIIDIAAIPGVTPPAAGEVPVAVITETDQYTGKVTWSPALLETGPDITLMSLTRTTATVGETGNQFFADSGVFADISNLTAWNNNQKIDIGGTGRTPIVINNGAANNNASGGNGWRSVGPMAIDAGITVDTATAFQLKFATAGYENIRFSASQKSTGSGPESFALAYSLSGPTGPFIAIAGSKLAAPREANNNEYADLRPSYSAFELPSALADKDEVYLRVYMVDCALDNRANGNTSINDLVIIGDTIGGDNMDATFAYNTVYTATITITPKEGFALAGVPANFFTVAGAAPVSNAASSGVVTAAFPITAAQPINIAAIPGITPPVAGASPVTTITETAQYTGTVTWSPAVSGTFAYNMVYTATITLTPKAGYTLTGVAANFFTVANATNVSNAANSGVVNAVFPSTSAQTVNIAAIPGVTAPVAGAAPITTIAETAQYTGTVTWLPAVSGTFAYNTAYTATITLTPKAGYTLNGVAANFFTVAGAASVSNAANSGVVTAVFPATALQTINIAAILGVTAPVAGAAPVTSITETAQYTGAVTWSPAVSGTFAYNTVYTATITLTAKAGYTLTGVAANFFTVAGTTSVGNAANGGVVTAVFPATELQTINIAAIPGVTVPVAGAAPVTVIAETYQYTGAVVWSPAVSVGFANNTVYTATITLTAKTGYTLTGVAANFFTVDGAASVSNAASSGVVTVVFPVTALEPVSIGLIAGVTAPVAGVIPITSIVETSEYSGTVTWSPTVSLTFAYNTVYTATITLTPKAGYTMDGVAADFFTVYSATSVSNAANSGVVTAVYPATELQQINITAIPGVVAPIAGAAPVTTIAETAQYTGTITWSPAVSGIFDNDTAYTATITLTPKTGYTLSGVAANSFTVAGATSVSNEANSGLVSAVFPATAITTEGLTASISLWQESGDAKAAYNVTNNSGSTRTILYILAIYDNGKMISIKTDTAIIPNGGNLATELNLNIPLGYTAKAFIWDGVTYIPLVESAQITGI
ncbi:MAG: CotH kinase family protein [Oscillospiraceae bacterium]|nr:CotH kinase family protein [Oscillospiraceae bacterium]